MASVNDQVKANHFDKFSKKTVLVDRNGNAYGLSNLGLPGNVISTTVTFDGNTANQPGDYDSGTANPITLANVTGVVGVNVVGYCLSTVTGTTAGLKVGIDSDDDSLIALSSAETIDKGLFWTGGVSAVSSVSGFGITHVIGEDIKVEATDANISGGSIRFLIYWEPLSDDGKVSK